MIARLAPNVDAQSMVQTVRQWKHLSALTQAKQEGILIKSVVNKARKQIDLIPRNWTGSSWSFRLRLRRYYNEERPHSAIGNKVAIMLTKSGDVTSP